MADLDQTKVQETPLAAEPETPNDDDQAPRFNSRQVQDVVKRERAKALEKGRQMALEELQAQQQAAAPQQQAAPSQPQPTSFGGMPQVSKEEIAKMIAEQAPQHLQAHIKQQAVSKQAESFVAKMRAAESKHPGLEAKLEKLDWTHMEPVINLLEKTSNPGDVMRELIDNPMKMGNLLNLAHFQPQMAEQAMAELSNSIQTNESAKAQDKQASEPLGLISPSNVGSDTGFKGSIQDFKQRYKN